MCPFADTRGKTKLATEPERTSNFLISEYPVKIFKEELAHAAAFSLAFRVDYYRFFFYPTILVDSRSTNVPFFYFPEN